MKKLISSAAIAAALLAVPASANEGRVEGRALLGFGNGSEDFAGGIAVGYDLDMGTNTFFGPEASLDTDFDGVELINLGGRLGVKTGDVGRLYVGAAYEINDIEAFNAGVGYQHSFNNKMYGKLEYRRFFMDGSDLNTAGIGVGIKF